MARRVWSSVDLPIAADPVVDAASLAVTIAGEGGLLGAMVQRENDQSLALAMQEGEYMREVDASTQDDAAAAAVHYSSGGSSSTSTARRQKESTGWTPSLLARQACSKSLASASGEAPPAAVLEQAATYTEEADALSLEGAASSVVHHARGSSRSTSTTKQQRESTGWSPSLLARQAFGISLGTYSEASLAAVLERAAAGIEEVASPPCDAALSDWHLGTAASGCAYYWHSGLDYTTWGYPNGGVACIRVDEGNTSQVRQADLIDLHVQHWEAYSVLSLDRLRHVQDVSARCQQGDCLFQALAEVHWASSKRATRVAAAARRDVVLMAATFERQKRTALGTERPLTVASLAGDPLREWTLWVFAKAEEGKMGDQRAIELFVYARRITIAIWIVALNMCLLFAPPGLRPNRVRAMLVLEHMHYGILQLTAEESFKLVKSFTGEGTKAWNFDLTGGLVPVSSVQRPSLEPSGEAVEEQSLAPVSSVQRPLQELSLDTPHDLMHLALETSMPC